MNEISETPSAEQPAKRTYAKPQLQLHPDWELTTGNVQSVHHHADHAH